MENTCS